MGLFLNYILLAYIAITMIATLVPLSPSMPISSIDPSWAFGMNEAVARGFTIGSEIIFTFGPYASLYSKQYHPNTDHLIICVSLYLAFAYTLLFWSLSKRFSKLSIILFSLLFLLFAPRDVIFFLYPLLAVLYAADFDRAKTRSPSWDILELAAVLSPLGLLPLIKGSFVLMVALTLISTIIFYIYRGRYRLATFLLVMPTISMLVFWIISGQPLISLPKFLLSILPLISSYTEAMAVYSDPAEVLVFLGVAALILATWYFAKNITLDQKLLILIILTSFLFITFKAGFVRHDKHALISAQALLGAALTLIVLKQDKFTWTTLFVSLIGWAFISHSQAQISTRTILAAASSTYINAWSDLMLRLSDSSAMRNRYEDSLQKLVEEYPIQKLEGSADIFSYDQAELLATRVKWHPRPIFQSYSAYTPELAIKNEKHFRRTTAPEHVVFRIQPIDGRLPSLEDGLVWTALSDNYLLERITGITAYLKKKVLIKESGNYTNLHQGNHKLGDIVILPESNGPIYAEISIEPTLLGKLLSILYKPPQLNINITLANGEEKQYRVISTMMRSAFMISPLVENIRSFAFVTSGNLQFSRRAKVKHFSINTSKIGEFFWQPAYKLRLKQHNKDGRDELPPNIFPEVLNTLPPEISQSTIKSCDGAIDYLNGSSPAPKVLTTIDTIRIQGWLAASTERGIAPDDIFIVFTDTTGKHHYIKTDRLRRRDVNMYFNKPLMGNVGYRLDADLIDFEGSHVLSMAYAYSGVLYHCNNLSISILFTNSEAK